MASSRSQQKTHKTRKPRKRRPSRKSRSRRRATKVPKVPKIVDPVFSKTIHRGTAASTCAIDYHYQSYETFASFLKIYVTQHPKIASYVYMPKDFSDMMVELDLSSGSVKPVYISEQTMTSYLKEGLRNPKIQLIPVILNLKIPKNPNHANVMVIDKDSHTIELFEPHGARSSASTLGGHVGAYNKKLRHLRSYWKDLLPDFTVVNTVDEVKRTAFQTEKDPVGHSGYCVTWSLLYTQYRILNPKVPYYEIIQHIDSKITTRLLLRYARYVEETLKGSA